MRDTRLQSSGVAQELRNECAKQGQISPLELIAAEGGVRRQEP